MNLTDPIFTDEAAARTCLEAQRRADGVARQRCEGRETVRKSEGQAHRAGLHPCGDCRQQVTVTVGMVFERSRVPLNTRLLATHPMASPRKGISAHHLHRSIGVTCKTAWFMVHRIREAMRTDDASVMGDGGGIVEADETFIGREPGKPVKRASHHRMKLPSLADRSTGRVRCMVVDHVNSKTIAPILRDNIAREARLMTDEASHCAKVGREVAEHGLENHGAGEHVLDDGRTNRLDGCFSIFKRGMRGMHQHCGKQHLHRQVAEVFFMNRFARAHVSLELTAKSTSGDLGKCAALPGQGPGLATRTFSECRRWPPAAPRQRCATPEAPSAAFAYAITRDAPGGASGSARS